MRAFWRETALVCVLLAGCPEESKVNPGAGRALDEGPPPAEDAGLPVPDAATGDSSDDVPAGEHCSAVASWDPRWAQFEEEVVLASNEARARPQDCHSEGKFEPAGPLVMEPHLRCAARLHALYMAEAVDDFGHVTRDGSEPGQRIAAAGYAYSAIGENLGVGLSEPGELVDAWLKSDGHCKVLMQPEFTEVGIGYAFGKWDTHEGKGIIDAPYWAQSLGAPPSSE
jgi:uncharacterized protein YkwD